jgi:uncharacterized membrane-anchored protein YitT (DUF2179 family)
VFFVLNLPFAAFAVRVRGWVFTAKSLLAAALVSVFAGLLPRMFRFDWLQPVYAATIGGFLIDAGHLMVFRPHAISGCVNMLVNWLQVHFGWRAGAVQTDDRLRRRRRPSVLRAID